MEEKKLQCLRCGADMAYIKTEDFQLGRTGLILGVWPNILAGALSVEIYCCRQCGKLEFFAAAPAEREAETLPQRACPNCGRLHDFDYPKCPFCKYDYYEGK